MRNALLASLVLLLSCHDIRGTTPRAAGCGKDTDCKGARVCDRGACVDPVAGRGGATNAVPDGGTAAPGPDAGARGGPGAATVTLPGASPMFHVGWHHQGHSRFRAPTSTPKEIGHAATGGTVFSSPAITDDGTAIFGSHDRIVRAVHLEAGAPGGVAVRWSRPTGDLVWCSPALGPGPTVYVGSDDDRLYALDPADGSVRWTFTAGPCKRAIGFGPEAARCDVDGVTVGPDGTVYLVADGLYAVGPDGVLRWRFPLATHCASAPAVGPDGTIYFGCQDARLYAVAPDGTKRWDFHAGDDIDGAPAVAQDGTIYVGSDDHRLYALAPSGALRFALATGGDVRASPAIAESGTVYVGSFDGNLYAVSPAGTALWTFSTADRILSSATIDSAGVVVFGSEDDRLYAVASDGKLVWSLLMDGDVDGTPAIGPGGTVYVGSDDKALHIVR